jgi:hypothetical protein
MSVRAFDAGPRVRLRTIGDVGDGGFSVSFGLPAGKQPAVAGRAIRTDNGFGDILPAVET